jgi:hypothetical protein
MADSTLQIWSCKLLPGHSGDEVVALSAAWLKAAKSMQGGADLRLSLEFPLAANAGEGGFNFVLTAPNPAVWGEFTNGYPGSAAAKADEDWEGVATCSEVSLWASMDIE